MFTKNISCVIKSFNLNLLTYNIQIKDGAAKIYEPRNKLRSNQQYNNANHQKNSLQPEVAKNYYRFLKGNDGNIMVNEIYQSDLGKNMCYPTLQKTLVFQKILQLKKLLH